MQRIRWPKEIKDRAKELRRQGYAFGQLTKELGVSKSTLHQWIRGLRRPARFTRKDRIRWVKEIQPLGAQSVHRYRLERLKKIGRETQSEINNVSITLEMLKAIAAMLYWAEGTKSRGMFQFANTDPKLMLLFVTLLRRSFNIDESKLRIRLYLHWYHKEGKAKKFWSELLHIPEIQFYKTYRKHRSKERRFRKNIGGICFLRYNSEDLRERILRYAYILGEKITDKIDVPVA